VEDPVLPLIAALALTALPPADAIFTDGDILSMVDGKEAPEALAVRNGRIAAVGKKADVLVLRGPVIQSAPEMAGKPEFAFGTTVDHVKIVGLKAVVDGSPQGRTSFYTKPYLVPGPSGQSPWPGQATVTPEELLAGLRASRAGGGQFFSHANGDAAIDMVIRAQQEAGVDAKADDRTVVVHSQFARPDQLDAYVRLGIVPSFFTNHTYYWGDDNPALVGEERAQGISPPGPRRRAGSTSRTTPTSW
jgi:predicted amidohydrolase YtcJ